MRKTWNAYKHSSKLVKASWESIEDDEYDLVEVLTPILGERLGRIGNRRATTGTGVGQMGGVMTEAALGVTAASATDVTWQELYALKHSVDPAYRNGSRWMWHDNMTLKVKTMTDNENRPLWQMGIGMGAPDTFDNDPYIVNQPVSYTHLTLPDE